jgi:hypothetical protein
MQAAATAENHVLTRSACRINRHGIYGDAHNELGTVGMICLDISLKGGASRGRAFPLVVGAVS